MDFDHSYLRYRVHALRNRRNGPQTDKAIAHVDSAVTAPYNSFTGVILQKGAALSAEIENYRRRVITFLNFLDSIAPHWWDKLHKFNDCLVKRPSRSAELVVKLQSQLKSRLTRLTPRMVIPAAAAVVTIEERDIIPVLPQNLLHSTNQRMNRRSNMAKSENIQEMLKLAYSIARRLGEVERSKQQLILYAVEWIYSDGRDFALRAQRLALLTKNIKHCLIEKFKGVQALITHYYRRRSTNNPEDGETAPTSTEMLTDSKYRLMNAFCEVTAASISKTNIDILQVMSNADLTLATDPAFSNDFIDNYVPSVFPNGPYSLSSLTTDQVSQDGYLPFDTVKGSTAETLTGEFRRKGFLEGKKLKKSSDGVKIVQKVGESKASKEDIDEALISTQPIGQNAVHLNSRPLQSTSINTPNLFRTSSSFDDAQGTGVTSLAEETLTTMEIR